MSRKHRVQTLAATTLDPMGDWYTVGLALGLGVALGTLFAGVFAGGAAGRLAAVALGFAGGALAGVLVEDWEELVGGAVGGVIGGAAAAIVVAGALRRGGTRGGLALIVAGVAAGIAALAFVPVLGYLEAVLLPSWPCASAVRSPSATPASGRLPEIECPKKLILIVIDGLTPSMLEETLGRQTAPSLTLLAEHGRYRRAVSTFPSLTPGLPLDARHRSPAGRARDSASRLVPPRRATARRVRLLVRGRARCRDEAVARGHRLGPEREPSREAGRHALRGARGRRPRCRGREHHVLPRAHAPPPDRSLASPGPPTGRAASSSTTSSNPT